MTDIAYGALGSASSRDERTVFFVSDSTGITAETLGEALLANFPEIRPRRHTIPFTDSIELARAAVALVQRKVLGCTPVTGPVIHSDEHELSSRVSPSMCDGGLNGVGEGVKTCG